MPGGDSKHGSCPSEYSVEACISPDVIKEEMLPTAAWKVLKEYKIHGPGTVKRQVYSQGQTS
jgi:hypothetical protein